MVPLMPLGWSGPSKKSDQERSRQHVRTAVEQISHSKGYGLGEKSLDESKESRFILGICANVDFGFDIDTDPACSWRVCACQGSSIDHPTPGN